ncbi:cbb3-type cytochrome oxidase subunit 3 [Candidimonas nitroreducens]|uniref:CcoQ/FixQ family Cbb3-type cytochrome c oxidase assembly chaperone n=1 Tax=Candidimonas nitroreducens TaxID=683354 RepID=A0A225M8S4_9BURK|nr:cbb3-type cytochrome c oxidase subunit 3 [Candidimonas nitroreducens]OWT57516.1 CcoQ/FixQ family Cbb3-type cytochrome c oxidase assembly chaperone [Candidimonas nitroreducens]
MNPLWGHFVGIFILLMMALFIGIWIWAWHSGHRPVFNRMAQLPMQDRASDEAEGRP